MESRQTFDVEQVRARTDLLALIGQYVTLRKRGARHVGLCPFHQEKSPSFGVDPEKGFWHCFGCGKGGDAFTFLMGMEHLTFPEALERLAQRAGVPPSLTYAEAPRRKEERDLLYEVNTAAAGAFQKGLQGRAGEMARRYLAQRGISLEDAQRFGLGYAPPMWDALITHLRGRQYSTDLLVKAGLALPRTHGEGHVDRFRNRLMIPIHDRQARVIAFGGRALSKEDQPKYLNTAETPIFHKSHALYALHLATATIAQRRRAIVTEGYFDAIACHLAGFTEAVATLGTALGEEHVAMLHRLVQDGSVYLVFDADSAGVNAALRSQALFRAAEVDVRIVCLPTGHDPDTLLREGGAPAFERCLAEALSPVAFEIDRLLLQFPQRDPESRVRFFRACAKILHTLPPLERATYAAHLVDRWLAGAPGDMASLQQAVLSEVMRLDRAGTRGHPEASPPPAESVALDVPLERELLTAMVQHPDFAAGAVTLVRADALTHAGYRAIFQALAALPAAGKPVDARYLDLQDDVTAALVAALSMRELPAALDYTRLVDRIRDEDSARGVRPQSIPLEDRDSAAAYTELLRARSRRRQRDIFGEQG